MIAKILACDGCGRSFELGTKVCREGSETRKAENRGTLTRVRLGRVFYSERDSRGKVVALDLCPHCKANRLINFRLQQQQDAARWGYRFVVG